MAIPPSKETMEALRSGKPFYNNRDLECCVSGVLMPTLIPRFQNKDLKCQYCGITSFLFHQSYQCPHCGAAFRI